MFKFKNQAGFSDTMTMLILGSIIAVLFIAGMFIWQEINIFKVVNGFLVSIENRVSVEAPANIVDSFETCLAAGQPVLESHPRQCIYIDGQIFVENLGDIVEDIKMIDVYNPKAGDFVDSPLIISGQARGTWFFEGDFSIVLTDEYGVELASIIASAKGEWMTENFVDFEAELVFEKPESDIGFLIFKKDNPSELSEHDDLISLPVFFQ